MNEMCLPKCLLVTHVYRSDQSMVDRLYFTDREGLMADVLENVHAKKLRGA